MIDIVADKIEKRRELGISDSLVVRFVALCGAVQEGEDVFLGDLINGTVTELPG